MEESNIIKNKAFTGVIWKAMERMCAQVVSLIVSIVLARILSPDDYSVVSIVTIFLAFCNVFISSGFNTALIQKKDANIIDYSSVLYVSIGSAIILYILMYFTAPLIANLYHKEILVAIIRVMSLTFFINAFKSILCAYISNTLQFKKFFLSTIIGTVISAIIGIYMASNGFGPWALVAQQMSNSIIDTLILYFTTKMHFVLKLSFKRLKSLFSYGWKMLTASIISTVYEEIKPLIVGVKFSTIDLAYYNKGKSFPSVINSSISDTISAVLFPVISKFQDDKEMVLHVTRKFMGIASYMIFPVMIGFFVVSDSFVEIVLTSKWMFAVKYIKIFCISYMFNIFQNGNLQAIRAIGRSDIFLKLEILKKSLYLVVIVLFIAFSKSPYVLAFSEIVCTIIATLINSRPNIKLIGYKYSYQIADILSNLLMAIIMGVVVYLIQFIISNKIICLLVQIIVGVLTYLFISILTKNKNFLYLIDLVKEKIGSEKSDYVNKKDKK